MVMVRKCGFRSKAIRDAGIGSTKKSPAEAGPKVAGINEHGARHATSPTPVHLRGPTRPNWGGGKPFLGYNSLGHDALDPPSHARCAKPRPAAGGHQNGSGRNRELNWGMPTGRVKFFNTDRGFGFIVPDDGGPDVFVHVHDIETAGMKILVADQLVVYELGRARDGRLKAVNLRLL